MKNLLLFASFVWFAQTATAQKDTLGRVWVFKNQVSQNLISVDGFQKANKILDSMAKAKNLPIYLCVATTLGAYRYALPDSLNVGELLNGTGFFGSQAKRMRFEDSAKIHLRKNAEWHQNITNAQLDKQKFKQKIILNLTLMQMMRGTSQSGGNFYVPYAKLRVLGTQDMQGAIPPSVLALEDDFGLDLTQSKSENDKRLAEWLRLTVGEITSNPCAGCREHEVMINLRTIDTIMKQYLCSNSDTMFIKRKIEIAAKCNQVDKNELLKIGTKIKIPLSNGEYNRQMACTERTDYLKGAVEEIIVVNELATKYNKKIYAHNLQDYTRETLETNKIFKPQEKRPIFHVVTHGDCSSLGYLTLNYRKGGGYITNQDIQYFDIGQPDLVWLHCCYTALGGRYSTTQAFMKIGAKQAIGSLWKVGDAAGPKIAKIFYEQYLSQNNPNTEDILYKTRLALIYSNDNDLNIAKRWAIYDYFNPKYTHNFTDYQYNEAVVEVKMDSINKKKTVYIVKIKNKNIDGIEIKYIRLVPNGIEFQHFGDIIKYYDISWKLVHNYLLDNGVKKIYMKVDYDVYSAISQCNAPDFNCGSAKWTPSVYIIPESNKYAIEYYDIIFLH